MKRNKIAVLSIILSISAIVISGAALLNNFPRGEKPIFSSRGINIGEIVKRLVKQERLSCSYRYYIILNEQPRFQMEKSAWDNFTGYESFGYIPKRYSAWEHFSWPEEVTPGKEAKYHKEIKPTNYGWKSWENMWGPKKSQ